MDKKNHSCKECGRQFVENPEKKVITQEEWDRVDKLLLERISIAGISRVTGVSEVWLQQYINKKYEAVSKKIEVPAEKFKKNKNRDSVR